MTEQQQPIIVVDADAIAAMPSPPCRLTKVPPRDNGLADLLELAKSEGCWVAYTSTWHAKHRQALYKWLDTHNFPRGTTYLRWNADTPVTDMTAEHTRLISEKALGNRPVIVIHQDADVAAELRAKGIAAIHAARVPQTVKGFRDLLTRASLVANTKPNENSSVTVLGIQTPNEKGDTPK